VRGLAKVSIRPKKSTNKHISTISVLITVRALFSYIHFMSVPSLPEAILSRGIQIVIRVVAFAEFVPQEHLDIS
jgi:hypothetical protein